MVGSDLVMADRALLKVLVGISRVRCPVAEGMICKLHITACAAFVMLAVVPRCPFAEGMRMSYIRADVVDCLGIGEDGQIDGAVCKQLILGDGNGDGSSGGRRGRTADGNGQTVFQTVQLLDFGGQTCGPIGKPTGNIITHCNVLKLLAVQSDGYIGIGDSLIDLAADRFIGNICQILAGIGIGNLIGFPCSAAVFIHDGFRTKCGRSAEGIRKPGFQHWAGYIAA